MPSGSPVVTLVWTSCFASPPPPSSSSGLVSMLTLPQPAPATPTSVTGREIPRRRRKMRLRMGRRIAGRGEGAHPDVDDTSALPSRDLRGAAIQGYFLVIVTFLITGMFFGRSPETS